MKEFDIQSLASGDAEAVRYLKQAIASGKHWYLALLGAMGLWTSAEERRHGRTCRYLIAGEAFDWLMLAERLCETVDGMLPDEEKTALLFCGEPPLKLTKARFKELIGSVKHRQYLNYLYGVAVEEALILAVQEEIRKEHRMWDCNGEHDDEAYYRIYGVTRAELLKQFREEKGYRQPRSISLTERKEFTYWLFKYRLEHGEKSRVASDTNKGLQKLNSDGLAGKLGLA